ncbi:MAG TPA: sensor histidine kinase [Vicinamibacterales bacterium]|nr:sensor histidine kinase [Vicinamibacterales bacterium]
MSAGWSVRGRLTVAGLLWAVGLFSLSTIVITLYPGLLWWFTGVHRHAHGMGLITIATAIGGFMLVGSAIVSLTRMRQRLADVRRGDEQRLLGSYPAEVQPLVDDLNALLEQRDQTVRRAIATAGDLAHGLKTPLAILAREADRAEAAGHVELAATITDQIDRMRRQIDRQLARARAAASGGPSAAHCAVAESAAALARTLQRLHHDRGITIAAVTAPDHMVRVQREDLDEMLGNLLDNACKWARTRVDVFSSSVNGSIVIDVDDDGPGLPPEAREKMLRRGVKADEAAPGSGLGLAIVSELAELYQGSIALTDSPLGGLRARLTLPDFRHLPASD